ncbi:murein L,D-transpeptidase catalytic domain family protein [Mucilaginibacter sp. McL0603]|uniref:murein L,D-transpeptidase catalytic domain family protein n=1 Tax=Mucilaginibacter sp. McL0603 TaxID=3415670 RepID=UPI003CEBBCE5
MKRCYWGITCVLLIFSISIISWKAEKTRNPEKITPEITKPAKLSAKDRFSQYIEDIYNTAQLNNAGMDMVVFQKAVTGFFNLKAANKVPQYSSIVTIVDLGKSSCTKRMWIVDLINKELVLNTWVAHGNGSGNDMASHFSNTNESHASSLGFYLADDVYNGKHGRSLRLDGLDAGFNDNARARSIVVHAAPYVSQRNIERQGRLGRSEGCPAVSPKVAGKVINTIKGKTVLFINGNDYNYTSKYLDEDVAANYVYPGSSDLNASL